ncbi:MAG: hypothetical protein RLZ35_345 [Pseudomonadota bacterium]|jgi:uncharacterized protein YqeY
MSDLKSQLTAAMKDCMKSGRKAELGVIRLIQAAIKQREVDERIALDDTQVIVLLDKMVRQRRDSVAEFTKAGRQDLADKETAEIAVIETFMPTPLTQEEVDAFVARAIASAQPQSIKDMAKVMAILKPDLQGRTDMGRVSLLLKEKLTALSG